MKTAIEALNREKERLICVYSAVEGLSNNENSYELRRLRSKISEIDNAIYILETHKEVKNNV